MDYTPIYDKYNGELRPLISEFEGREEQFEEPILKSMAYMVDELSLCVQSDNSADQQKHFEMASQNLEEAVINGYKYLVFSHHKQVKKFKRRFSKYQMQLFNNGKFVGKFNNDSEKAKEFTRHARKNKDFLNCKEDYKQAYDLYSEIEYEISEFESEGAAMESRERRILLTVAKFFLSIAISVGVAYFVSF